MATASTAEVGQAEPLVLEWKDLLIGKDLTKEIREAFGEGGLGLLAVRGVPGLAQSRQALLPLAHKVGSLPEEAISKYERPETLFCSGWSRGREQFKGKPDVSKGSWYANPIYDDPADGDEAVRAKFPFAAARNVWPSEVPHLEIAFKSVGNLVYEAAKPLIKQCDRLVQSSFPSHQRALYEKTFEQSRSAVGRLLHYYPGQEDSWCGWHNDNSCITGLLPAMWLDSATGEQLPGLGDSSAGLYVQDRSGKVARVVAPSDCLLFQVGEAAQILSGGVLRATPHYVRGHRSVEGEVQVSRETFAFFMQPQWDMSIGPPQGATSADVLKDEETELIPPLSKRWRPDPDTKLVEFGKFLGDSVQEYYKLNNE